MNNKNKKGFTLIELLAVIAVLAIILLIAVPAVLNIIESVKYNSFKASVKSITSSAKYVYSYNHLREPALPNILITYNNGVETSNLYGIVLDYKGNRPKSGTIRIEGEGQMQITMFNDKYCATKNFGDLEFTFTIQSEATCIETVAMPTITLNGSSSVNVPINGTYTELGATALDSAGVATSSITSRILKSNIVQPSITTSTRNSYDVIYRVTDGTKAVEVTRNVSVVDITSPTIALIGGANLSIDQNTTYTDLGATASDSYDGNITGRIARTGAVNTAIPGLYTLSYNVTDLSGNAATTVTRNITVVAVPKSASGTAIVSSSVGEQTITVSGLNFTPKIVVIEGMAYTDETAERNVALASTPTTTTGLIDDAMYGNVGVGHRNCTKVIGGFTYTVSDNSRSEFANGSTLKWYAYEDYTSTGNIIVPANETITVTGLSYTPSMVIIEGMAYTAETPERNVALASTPTTTTGILDDAWSGLVNVGARTCTKVSGGFTYTLSDNTTGTSRTKFGAGNTIKWYTFK